MAFDEEEESVKQDKARDSNIIGPEMSQHRSITAAVVNLTWVVDIGAG